MNKELNEILKDLNFELSLVDLGASGDNWTTYDSLKEFAHLVRFDPDLRDIRKVNSSTGKTIITINKAVVDKDQPFSKFYLTKSPYCSSTLEPDYEKLRSFTYIDLFEVEKEINIPSTTLEKSLIDVGVSSMDWLKIDTQGTEGRILNSLNSKTVGDISVFEIEASLYRHYKDADILPEIHNFMLSNNFWIVKFLPHWNSRITKESFELLKAKINPKDEKYYNFSRQKQVTTFEFFYLKTIDGAIKDKYDFRQFLTLYVCHNILNAFEYCLDILYEMKKLFRDKIDIIETLLGFTYKQIQKETANSKRAYYLESLFNRLSRVLL